MVDADIRCRRVQVLDGDEDVDFAPLEDGLDAIAQPVFQGQLSMRHADIQFQKTLVHSAHFKSDSQFPVVAGTAAKTSHTSHLRTPLLVYSISHYTLNGLIFAIFYHKLSN